MHSPSIRRGFGVLFFLIGSACLTAHDVYAQLADHLECYKIKDAIKLGGTANLNSPQFGLAPGCKLSKAKLFCVPATKSNVAAVDKETKIPITPLTVSSGPAGTDRICYDVTCPTPVPAIADQNVTDQFGNRTLSNFTKGSMLCTPAVKGSAYCGDSAITGSEECEGSNLAGASCRSLGFETGALGCTHDCGFDTSACGCDAGVFPATGQTTAYKADKNDGIVGPVTVPDDGTVQAEATLSFVDNGDGTVTDLVTGLMWEKKGDDGGLHDKDNKYPWSGNGTQDTFWDWLDDVNAEGGTGFAGHNDWRLPTIKELYDLIDFQHATPYSAPPIFNVGCVPGCSVTACSCAAVGEISASSTTDVSNPNSAWQGYYESSIVPKSSGLNVRAVRGGSVPVVAQVNDHLECYKIKDSLKLGGHADLDSPQFGLAPGCKLSKAKKFCVPARKSNVAAVDKNTKTAIIPLPVSSGPAGPDRICYNVTCPKPVVPIADQNVTDQFGNRTLSSFTKASVICTPAVKGSAYCGDGIIGTGEDCDGPALGGATCQSLGFESGTLACGADCQFDRSDCGCTPGAFPATGQTTAYTADKNDGIAGAVAVPDDGTVRPGIVLSYVDNGDGTITDLNTGLMWEKKGDNGGLHDQGDTYVWSGNGTQETIWDWLDDVNVEGGTGFAGYNDWRIPTIKELFSIVDFQTASPAVSSYFNTGCGVGCDGISCSCTPPTATYWSSTSFVANGQTMQVFFVSGRTAGFVKQDTGSVRAVRGGTP